MKAVQFNTWGPAADVLSIIDTDEPAAPAADEVTVQVTYSPVNLHDIGFIEGHLVQTPLPATPGNEGIGTVIAAGSGVTHVAVGDTVVLPLLAGTWRERLTVPAETMFPLPDGDAMQLSMLGSNTPTAGLMLSEYADLEPGDWIVQDAANGGVGRNVIAIAKQRGLRSVNFVRSESSIPDLKAAGADVVLIHGPNSADEIRSIVGETGVGLAIDSVGGPVTDTMLEILIPGSAIVFYGNASRTPINKSHPAIAKKNLRVAGIFVGAFDREAKVLPVIRDAAPLVASGELTVPIDAVYPLEDVVAAATHVVERGGKVLLSVTADI